MDVFGIKNAIAGYCQAYDDRDRSALEEVLAPDCILRMHGGTFAGQTYTPRTSIVDWLSSTWSRTPPCLHFTGNSRIVTVDGETRGQTDYLFIVHDEGGFGIASIGRYIDRFERVDDRWVIAERIVSQGNHGEARSGVPNRMDQ